MSTHTHTTHAVPAAITPADELYSIALRIREHQLARDWSLSVLMKRHGGSEGLGSDKTFNKILRQDFSEIDIEKKVVDYRTVLALLDELPTEETVEDVYDDLSGPVKVRRAMVKAMTSQTPARLVIVEGNSGMGKSCALNSVKRIYGARLLMIEASDTWGDRPNAFLASILIALGQSNIPINQFIRAQKVETLLKESRRGLLIEEAHHLGPKCLNVLKTLMNKTGCEAILFAIPTLLKRLEHIAYEEAVQLFTNRLAERIKLTAINKKDVEILLSRKLAPWDLNGDLVQAAELLTANAPKRGNLAFVREVCRRVVSTLKEEGRQGEKITLGDITAAAEAEIQAR